MTKAIKEKLYDAKMGLKDLCDNTMMEGVKMNNNLVQKRVILALEAIDDALEGRIKFRMKEG